MFRNLEAEMARRGLNRTELAKCLGTSPRTVCNKMCGKTDFTAKEMKLVQDRLAEPERLTLDYLFETNAEQIRDEALQGERRV